MKRLVVVGLALLLSSSILSSAVAQDITIKATDTPVPTITPIPPPPTFTPIPTAPTYEEAYSDGSFDSADGWSVRWHSDQWSSEVSDQGEAGKFLVLRNKNNPENTGIALSVLSDKYSTAEEKGRYSYLDTSECISDLDYQFPDYEILEGNDGNPLSSTSPERSWAVFRIIGENSEESVIAYGTCLMLQPAVSYIEAIAIAPDEATFNDVVAPEIQYILSTLSIKDELGSDALVTPTP